MTLSARLSAFFRPRPDGRSEPIECPATVAARTLADHRKAQERERIRQVCDEMDQNAGRPVHEWPGRA